MLSGNYFADVDYTAYHVAVRNTGHMKELSGKVAFDLGYITLPNTGITRICGEFPRIKPLYQRERVTPQERKGAVALLTAWVDQYFDRSKEPTYFNNLIDSTTNFTLFIDPFHDIDSKDMQLAMQTYFWLWHCDDVFELAIAKNIPFKIIEAGFDQFMKILSEDEKVFKEVYGCSGFRSLFNSLVSIHEAFAKKHAENYRESSNGFRFFLNGYFQAMRMWAIHRLDGAFSKETFRFFRRMIAYFDGIAEVIMLIEGLILPSEIFGCPSLRRILDVANSTGGFINDLLGLKKELEYGQTDNYVVFQVLEKGVPVEKAVKEVCDLVQTELQDYLLLREGILQEFSYNPVLVKYIDILEALIDGHNLIYDGSERHLSAGGVRLIR